MFCELKATNGEGQKDIDCSSIKVEIASLPLEIYIYNLAHDQERGNWCHLTSVLGTLERLVVVTRCYIHSVI